MLTWSSSCNTSVHELTYDHFAPAFLFWSKTFSCEGSPVFWVVKMTRPPLKQTHVCLCSPHIIYNKENHKENIKIQDFLRKPSRVLKTSYKTLKCCRDLCIVFLYTTVKFTHQKTKKVLLGLIYWEITDKIPGECIGLALKHQHISTMTLRGRSEHCNLSKEIRFSYWVLDQMTSG